MRIKWPAGSVALKWLHITPNYNYFCHVKLQSLAIEGGCGMNSCKVQIMDTAMFHTPILTILSLIILSSKNKAVEVSGFAVIFNGI